jgi:tight adherence protein C
MESLYISVIIGCLIGILGFRWSQALHRALFRYRQRGRARQGRAVSEQLLPVLRAARAPRWLRTHWGMDRAAPRLMHAGLPWTAEEYAALRWIALLGCAALGVGLGAWRAWDLMGVSLAGLLLLCGWFGPQLWLHLRVESRQLEIDHQLPDFLDRMALGLEAGLAFQIALQRTAVNFPRPLGYELRRMVRQLERGHSRAHALEELNQRTPSQELRAFAAAVKQSERLGTSLSRSFRVQTELLRAGRRRRAQEASRRLPILIVFPLVVFFLPSLLIIYLAPPLLHLLFGR